jgi:hypothetical protein
VLNSLLFEPDIGTATAVPQPYDSYRQLFSPKPSCGVYIDFQEFLETSLLLLCGSRPVLTQYSKRVQANLRKFLKYFERGKINCEVNILYNKIG